MLGIAGFWSDTPSATYQVRPMRRALGHSTANSRTPRGGDLFFHGLAGSGREPFVIGDQLPPLAFCETHQVTPLGGKVLVFRER